MHAISVNLDKTAEFLDDFETQFHLPSDAVELGNLFRIKASGRNVGIEQNMGRLSRKHPAPTLQTPEQDLSAR